MGFKEKMYVLFQTSKNVIKSRPNDLKKVSMATLSIELHNQNSSLYKK